MKRNCSFVIQSHQLIYAIHCSQGGMHFKRKSIQIVLYFHNYDFFSKPIRLIVYTWRVLMQRQSSLMYLLFKRMHKAEFNPMNVELPRGQD